MVKICDSTADSIIHSRFTIHQIIFLSDVWTDPLIASVCQYAKAWVLSSLYTRSKLPQYFFILVSDVAKPCHEDNLFDTTMNSKNQPLVSCIMPTYNRRKLIPFAIAYFLRQDYSRKELIILDDGTDTVEDLVPKEASIRYYRLNKKITLGEKLNKACQYANGDIIAHWDDDDWYNSGRLTYQINALQNKAADVCGINQLLYFNLSTKHAYRYSYPANQRPWLLGSSLCYTKSLWTTNPFASIDVGMDALFVWGTPSDKVKVLPDSTIAVHMIHEDNVSPKKIDGSWWNAYPVAEMQKIMMGDFHTYSNEVLTMSK